jgi:hypothetical protein
LSITLLRRNGLRVAGGLHVQLYRKSLLIMKWRSDLDGWYPMKKLIVIAIAIVAALGLAGGAYALGAISVNAPLFPAVGQATAKACDSDGVDTTYTYGNSSAKGVKVESGTITGIESDCKTATMEFVDASEAIVKSYSGKVTEGSATVSTNIFTNEFDSVRVILSP